MNASKDPLHPFLEVLRRDLPSAEDDARVRERLQAIGIAVPMAAAPVAATPALGASLAAKLGASPTLVKLGLAGTLLAGTGSGVVIARRAADSSVDPAVAAVDRQLLPASRPRARTVGASPELRSLDLPPLRLDASPEPPLASAVPPVPTASRRRTTPPERRSPEDATHLGPATELPASDPATLAAETALIQEALVAIERGAFETARRALERHEARYPRGLLARERGRAEARLQRRSPSKTPARGNSDETNP